jgi:hypothetical protein
LQIFLSANVGILVKRASPTIAVHAAHLLYMATKLVKEIFLVDVDLQYFFSPKNKG